MYVLLAILSAVAFAIGSVLKHRSAQDLSGPDGDAGLASVVTGSITHRLWLTALVVDGGGFVLQVLALALGPLDVVQPLVTISVVLALFLSRERAATATVAWSGVLIAAVAVLGVIGAGGHSSVQARPDGVPAVLATVLVTLVLLACLWVGRGPRGRWVAVVCGLGAGISYAASAGLIKTLSLRLSDSGVLGVVGAWQLYTLVASGAVGILLCQLGFRAGPLRQSLPAASAIDPVASIVLGVAVFDEPLGGGVPGGVLFAAVVAVLAVAVLRVSRTVTAGLDAPPAVPTTA